MVTIIGGILLLGSIAGIILCTVNSSGSSVLLTAFLFLTMIIGGVMVFDNGSEKGLKFPDVFRIFGGRRSFIHLQRLRVMAERGEITWEEYESRKKELMRKYGMKGGRQ